MINSPWVELESMFHVLITDSMDKINENTQEFQSVWAWTLAHFSISDFAIVGGNCVVSVCHRAWVFVCAGLQAVVAPSLASRWQYSSCIVWMQFTSVTKLKAAFPWQHHGFKCLLFGENSTGHSPNRGTILKVGMLKITWNTSIEEETR